MRRVLMVAYHFPPLAGSSGIQRTLRFVRHLPAAGWEPLVLTTVSSAHERTSADLDADVPAGLVVRRALAFDAARQLSIFGRYPAALGRPDRWMTWLFDGTRVGLRLVREFKPQVLWSTYPIATAHMIGRRLHERTGLPWVADFRDPMAQDGYPEDPKTWAIYKRIEEDALRLAARSVFTTPGAAREYAHRYPERAKRLCVIENGYDEESFALVEGDAAELGPLEPGHKTLLHSGIVYPSERDPTALMDALGRLKRTGVARASGLRVRFRAAVHEDFLRSLARRFDVADLVEIAAPIAYREALLEMMRADGLLLLQASNCNEQIPAKVYEYLRAGRPLLALTDPEGDTAGTLRAAGVRKMARLDNAEEIAQLIEAWMTGSAACASFLPEADAVRAASRARRALAFAQVLEQACALAGE